MATVQWKVCSATTIWWRIGSCLHLRFNTDNAMLKRNSETVRKERRTVQDERGQAAGEFAEARTYLFPKLTFIVLLQKSCEANCALFQQLQVEIAQALVCCSLVCILSFVWLIRCSKICRANWVNWNQISNALRFDNLLNPIASFLTYVSTWS